MKRLPLMIAILVATTVLDGTAAQAEKPFRYGESKHGNGELRYVNDIPFCWFKGRQLR